jgi:hypothetical protein
MRGATTASMVPGSLFVAATPQMAAASNCFG